MTFDGYNTLLCVYHIVHVAPHHPTVHPYFFLFTTRLPLLSNDTKKGMIAHIVQFFFGLMLPLLLLVLLCVAFNFHIFMRGCFMARYNILSWSMYVRVSVSVSVPVPYNIISNISNGYVSRRYLYV